MLLWIGLLFFLQSAGPPYKASDEFEVKIDFQIKARPLTPDNNASKIDLTETTDVREKKQAGPSPYLAFKVKFLKLSDQEVKVKITDGSGKTVYQKKSKEGSVINLEMGFIEDIKKGLVSGEYKILLLSPEKKPATFIHLLVSREGTYKVNEVLCGKF